METIQATSLEDFKKQLDGKNEPIKIQDDNKKVIQVRKNLVLSVQSDFAGCSHIRNIWWFSYINAVFGKSQSLNCIVAPYFTTQNDLLVRAKTLWFQRVMSPQHLHIVKQYKDNQAKLGYKMIYDIDDYIWGNNEMQGGTKEDGVPSYNFGSKKLGQETKDTAIEVMNMMNIVTVSSDYLGEMLRKHGVKTEIKLLKNTVAQSFWGAPKRIHIKEKIKKPKIIWSGSPTHWSDQDKLLGDIDNAWLEYIKKNVIDGKIDFMQMGGTNVQGKIKPPFFFDDIKDNPNFHTIGWLNSYQYHLPIKDYSADFAIAPLVDNNFNRSKSDIKAIEAYASNSVFIGTKFKSGFPSPYDDAFLNVFDDCSVKDIEDLIEEYSEPEKYNEIINKQFDYMNNEGRWTESPIWVNQFTSLL